MTRRIGGGPAGARYLGTAPRAVPDTGREELVLHAIVRAVSLRT